MGVVGMKSELIVIDRGYPLSRVTLYIYCDHCGSFQVSPYFSLRRWLMFVATAGLVGIGALAVLRPTGPVWWLLALVILCFLPLKRLWELQADWDDPYKCRKCGSRSQDNYNTRNYPLWDLTIVDAPDHLIQKRYMGFGPEDYGYDLADVLKPPQVPRHTSLTQILRDVGSDALRLLSIPLLIVGLAIGSILLVVWMIVGSLWIDVLSKPFTTIRSGKNGR